MDDSGEYDYGDRHDYPSSAYIAKVLNENSIIPIFAVENDVRNVYDQLRDEIRSAFVATRTARSEDLLDLVVSTYTVRQRESGGKQVSVRAGRQAGRWEGRQAGGQAGGQAGRQAGR